ncbi:uncharacterized protein [Rutidosis leptorrhynchoides]|uniref:uncharacterized protein n=1 Tax=Rutidosis leptorrhynchoides TaxID=125765 RepID=UPI003A997FC6
MNQLDYQNPLYLHPSEGPGSLAIQEKLTGVQNYRSWRRSIEIKLSTKRKSGFITGTIARPVNDEDRAEQWDTCNNMVISWIMSSVSDQIAKSIMFIGTSFENWRQLEKRFALSNGSREYKLHKETYSMEQEGMVINEYYTKMKCICEELDSMSQLPRITNLTPEVTTFFAAYDQQKKEQHMFQFLNSLDEHFGSIRSQLLLMNPLPNVESACSMLQQEESQREMFSNFETKALYSKNNQSTKSFGSKQAAAGKFKGGQTKRTTANVQGSNIVFTSEQFEQLLKCLPQMAKDEMQYTGATDHITPVSKYLKNSKSLFWKPKIKLPNGDSSVISHIGNITLDNEIGLKGVLVILEFQFSLLSVPKLTRDISCAFIFFSQFCVIQDLTTKKVM